MQEKRIVDAIRKKRGFAAMTLEDRTAAARKGGRNAQELGVGFNWRWDREAAAKAGSKGGTISRGGKGRKPKASYPGGIGSPI